MKAMGIDSATRNMSEQKVRTPREIQRKQSERKRMAGPAEKKRGRVDKSGRKSERVGGKI